MAIERHWEYQAPIAFTADGGADGLVTVSSVECLKVKQNIVVSAVGLPDLALEVKRVISFTQLIVGPKQSKLGLKAREDISAYTVALSASIRAEEQSKTRLDPRDIIQSVYEHEPTIAIRTMEVDKIGHPYTVSNPFPTLISDGQDIVSVNADGSINVKILEGAAGTPIVHKESSTITNITETTVATFTATVDNSNIFKLSGEAHTYGIWRIYKNVINTANLEDVIRTSPTVRTALLKLEQPVLLSNTDQIIVTFEAERYRSSLLGVSSNTFVRLEGFIL